MGVTVSPYMQRAFNLALIAEEQGEVPVGAVVVLNNEIIGEGYNQPIRLNDATAHAEITAIRQASKRVGNYRLNEANLYVTLEPCAMCAGAMVHARIKRLFYAASDSKAGACGSVFNLVKGFPLNHAIDVHHGMMADESSQLLKRFFKARRR